MEKIQEASLVYLPANALLFLTSFQRLHYVQSIFSGFSDSLPSYLEAYFLGIKSFLLFIVQIILLCSAHVTNQKKSILYIIINIFVFDF